MNKFQSPKVIAIRSLIAILSICFGILISAQFRSLPNRKVLNPVAPYISLKETKEELYKEQSQLKEEIKSLQKSIEQAQDDSESTILTKEELNSLNRKKAQAGITRLNGQGVIITIDDSKISSPTDDSIVHAADLRDLMNLLWVSGAEGISINGQRVVLGTAIDCIVNTILVNNVRLSVPFRIEAIGDQNKMYQKLSDRSLLSNIYDRKKNQGLIYEFTTNSDITLPIYDGYFETSGGIN